MLKMLIAAALGAVVLVSSAGILASAKDVSLTSNDEDDYHIDITRNPHRYYHHCERGIADCHHYFTSTYIGLNAMGVWGFVYSPDKDHQDTYKYISVTTYSYNKKTDVYSKIKTIPSDGYNATIISNNANINGDVAKVVFNGKIYYTSPSSGILQNYLITPIRSGCPLK